MILFISTTRSGTRIKRTYLSFCKHGLFIGNEVGVRDKELAIAGAVAGTLAHWRAEGGVSGRSRSRPYVAHWDWAMQRVKPVRPPARLNRHAIKRSPDIYL